MVTVVVLMGSACVTRVISGRIAFSCGVLAIVIVGVVAFRGSVCANKVFRVMIVVK